MRSLNMQPKLAKNPQGKYCYSIGCCEYTYFDTCPFLSLSFSLPISLSLSLSLFLSFSLPLSLSLSFCFTSFFLSFFLSFFSFLCYENLSFLQFFNSSHFSYHHFPLFSLRISPFLFNILKAFVIEGKRWLMNVFRVTAFPSSFYQSLAFLQLYKKVSNKYLIGI